MIYVLQHTITKEILAAFSDKGLAIQWHYVVNYSTIIEIELQEPELLTCNTIDII